MSKAPHPLGGSALDRLRWAERTWTQNPLIPVHGESGMIKLLTERFGRAASVPVLRKVLHDVLKTTSKTHVRVDRPNTQNTPASEPVIMTMPKKTSKQSVSTADKIAFAMDVLKRRPNIRHSGQDSINELMRKQFGCGIAHSTWKTILANFKPDPDPEPDLEPDLEPEFEPEPEFDSANTRQRNAALATATKLIRDTVDDLRSFNLMIEPDGRAKISIVQSIELRGSVE